jgi:hypothetical protein
MSLAECGRGCVSQGRLQDGARQAGGIFGYGAKIVEYRGRNRGFQAKVARVVVIFSYAVVYGIAKLAARQQTNCAWT